MSKSNGIWGNIFKKLSGPKDPIASILGQVPLFSDLKGGGLMLVVAIAHVRSYKAGEVIFWEGEPGVGMYVIEKGEVSICTGADTEHPNELARLSDGDFFGEMALLSEAPRSASAKALKDSSIIGLFRPELFDLIEQKPTLGIKVLKPLAEMVVKRLKTTTEDLDRLREEQRLQAGRPR